MNNQEVQQPVEMTEEQAEFNKQHNELAGQLNAVCTGKNAKVVVVACASIMADCFGMEEADINYRIQVANLTNNLSNFMRDSIAKEISNNLAPTPETTQ